MSDLEHLEHDIRKAILKNIRAVYKLMIIGEEMVIEAIKQRFLGENPKMVEQITRKTLDYWDIDKLIVDQ